MDKFLQYALSKMSNASQDRLVKFCRFAFRPFTTHLANQYAMPVKPAVDGNDASKMFAEFSAPLNRVVVDNLNISKGDKVLELGYGRGDGIGYCLQKMKGEGLICGIDHSEYMEEVVRKRFYREITESNVVRLDKCSNLKSLPYPSNFFDSIYHVDFFYFLQQKQLHGICHELLRVLKPKGRMVCGMEWGRLEQCTKWGTLEKSQWDPMRYAFCLKPVGFKNVKIDDIAEPDHLFHLISAEKPEHAEVLMKEAKERMLMDNLKKILGVQTDEELDDELERIGEEARKDVEKKFRLKKKETGHTLTKEDLEFLDEMKKRTKS